MLCVIIQPKNYKNITKLDDLASMSVIRFPEHLSKSFEELEDCFDVVYEGAINKDIFKDIFKEVENERVITYSKWLLSCCMHAINNDLPEYEFESSNITGLMEQFIEGHPKRSGRGRFYSLSDALKIYGIKEVFDRDDPQIMSRLTFKLFRCMQKDEKFAGAF